MLVPHFTALIARLQNHSVLALFELLVVGVFFHCTEVK